jgi:predicted GIY-YIG superfamily endonuclease
MFYGYVLRNTSNGKHYTGHTEYLEQRVQQHNHGVTKSTKNRVEWKLVHLLDNL